MVPPPIRKDDLSSSAEDFSFSDLVDVPELHGLMEVNYAATGMPSGIIDVLTGEVYAGAGVATHLHEIPPRQSGNQRPVH